MQEYTFMRLLLIVLRFSDALFLTTLVGRTNKKTQQRPNLQKWPFFPLQFQGANTFLVLANIFKSTSFLRLHGKRSKNVILHWSVLLFLKSTRTRQHQWVFCALVCTKKLIEQCPSPIAHNKSVCCHSGERFLLLCSFFDVKMQLSPWCSLLAQKCIQPSSHLSACVCTFQDKKSFTGPTFFGQMATGWILFYAFWSFRE